MRVMALLKAGVRTRGAKSRAVPGVSSAELGETCAARAPNTARKFIDFRLGLRLHARN